MFEFLLVANISVQGGIEAAPVGVARLTAEMTAVFWRTAPRWPLVRLGCVFAPVLSASQTDGRGWHCWQIGALQKRRTCGSEPRKKAGRSLTMGGISSQAGALSLGAALVHTCMCTSNLYGIGFSDSKQPRSVSDDANAFCFLLPRANATFVNALREGAAR